MEKISTLNPMELFDQENKEVVVSFDEGLKGDPSFNKKYELLIKDLGRGIRLPEALRTTYGDKLAVYPGDEGFGVAFYTLYFPSHLAGGGTYVWRPVQK